MLTIRDSGTTLCDHLTRRDWLRIGGLGALGLSLPTLLSARAPAARTGSFGKAKACILVGLTGGPPQHETWDPKPDAPAEIRGAFQPIASSVPGLQVCELMPRLAQQAHHFAVLRAASTRDNAHSSSGYYMMTGVPHLPANVENARPGAPNNWPSVAALVNRLKSRPGGMPASVVIPEHIWNDGNVPWPGQDAGFLGRATDPWLLHCDPSAANLNAPALAMPAEMTPLRFDERRSLLDQVNRHLDTLDRSAAVTNYNHQFRQALDMMQAGQVRRAFDMQQEPAALRDRYGRSRYAQSVLLARRLVEAGISLVQINWTRMGPNLPNQGGWDTHEKNAESLSGHLMPLMDRACSALIEDLAVRGLLDETLVVWMGEFGRTPRHNANGGRDHWGSVFSLAMAGGGVRAGVVHGSSDRLGAYPREGMVLPQDITATIFHLLGIAPGSEVHDTLGRPIAVSRGEVIRQVV
ncbi:MAG: DUF1501 domain-containing protein [Gemmataceae bacterium]|nr:DUF1501 domain-containing protein [Gemmataceae bacterium]